jgi:perosamine synthetase
MSDTLAIDGGNKAIPDKLPSIQGHEGRMIGKEELAELAEVVESGCFSFLYGTKVKAFEAAFAELYGMPISVAVSSGTAALHAAITYVNPEPGDEIIVSPITDMGSIIPVLAQLAIPVFADVDPQTHTIDPREIERCISPRTKAIIVTHIYGAPADMDPIMDIAGRHGIPVIEDCAQSHMTLYKGRLTGTIGDLGCFSFQQAKHMTMGDGGLVIARRDNQFGRSLRQCTDKGWPREKGGRDHLFLAPNYHMTELQAAVGLAQLKKLPEIVARRRASGHHLTKVIEGHGAYEVVAPLADSFETYFFHAFRMRPEAFRATMPEVIAALQAEGLPCFLGYPGSKVLYKYPVIRDHKTFGNSGWPFTLPGLERNWNYDDALCPVAERMCAETLVIWWSEGLTLGHADQIAAAMAKVADAMAA